MTEHAPQPSKPIEEISQDLGNEAQALSDIHDQGLRPEDQEVWAELVAEHKDKYAEHSSALAEMTRRKVNQANDDLQYRQELMDHNAR